jgi:hypothetical protein
MVEAHEGKPLPALIVPELRRILLSLNVGALVTDKAKRALRVLKSFVNGVKFSVNDIDIGLSIAAEDGSADSGDLESDLTALFVAVGDAGAAAGCPIALCLDEMQYLSDQEFSALIMAIHKTNQLKLPIVLVGAGLPQIVGLAGASKSYAERLFDYPPVGALAFEDARAALVAPAHTEGVVFTDDALDEILRVTQCYPYFLQQWGHDSWNVARKTPIDLDDVNRATTVAIAALDDSFFRVRFDRCTPAEKRYLRALAELGPGNHRSGEIADCLNVKVTSVAPTRSNLIKKGMIFSPQFGGTEFTVPLFDDYMRRAMPDLDS